MAFVEQRKIANIDRGLFLVRYAAAEDERHPPHVKVLVGPQSGGGIGFVLHPDHADSVLRQPGSCLVVTASSPGQLVVEVTPSQRDGSSAATVKIEPLSQGDAVPLLRPTATQTFAGGGLRILAHVAGLGDISAAADEWLAGPEAPSRIEGLAVEWPAKPNGLHVNYSVKTARPQNTSDVMMELGEFAGTRGRALPIVGVVFELSGPAASSHHLVAEALFLGSARRRAAGRRVAMKGPTGREPLVGLRLQISAAIANSETVPPAAAVGRNGGRVRVFRSSAPLAVAP
jgi:hypothetical protein